MANYSSPVYTKSNISYLFGEFRLDVNQRTLFQGEREVPLSPRLFDTLFILVQNSGRLISRDEMIQAVWRDTSVDPSSLKMSISALRKALGEGPDENKYIMTVPRRGYRFVATVTEQATTIKPAVLSHALEMQRYTRSESITEELISQDEDERKQEEPITTQPSDAILHADSAQNQTIIAPHMSGHRPSIKLKKAGIFIAVIATVAILVFLAYRLAYKGMGQTQTAFQNMKMSKLTATGRAETAIISPDGKYIAYSARESGKRSLWLRQLIAPNAVKILPAIDGSLWGMTFSPDNEFIYYVVEEPNNPALGALYKMPALGGPSARILEKINSAVTFSPDFKHMAFVRMLPDQGLNTVIVADVDGTNERILATRKLPDALWRLDWSPDGKLIACTVGGRDEEGDYWSLVAVRIEDGSELPLTTKKWKRVNRVLWMPEGNGLVVTAVEQGTDTNQIWHISYPAGEVRRITNDVNNYEGLSLSAYDEDTIISTQFQSFSNIWTMPNVELDRSDQGPQKINQGGDPYWTPDGQIVYTSRAGGNLDIWIMNADGSQQKQLTSNSGINWSPAVSPDAHYIFFISNRNSCSNLYRMDINGTNLKQMSNYCDEFPQVTPDGKWVIYLSYRIGEWNIWRMPVEGGKAEQLTDTASERPLISPDGSRIAYEFLDKQDRQYKFAVIPISGGAPIKIIKKPTLTAYLLGWTTDGQGFIYSDNRTGKYDLWMQSLKENRTRQLTDSKFGEAFNFKGIFYLERSPDHKRLALTNSEVISDVVAIKNFR